MSLKIIQERFDEYHCASRQEEEQALREITQEVALAALSRAGFFKLAGFQGGTALRILYSLQRFSEDLDFLLRVPRSDFGWEPYLKHMIVELSAYGFAVQVADRSKAADPVQKAFLKEQSIGKILRLRYPLTTGRPKQIQIKFELDTNPPQGSRFETKYLDFPFPFPVTVQDLASLFAGKSHALLCREYLKGRDWYDFVWYAGRKPTVNYDFLAAALHQQGPWQGTRPQVTKEWYLDAMRKKIIGTDWNEAKNDVARFLKPNELRTLELWSAEFFLDRLAKIAETLP
ncbi:MAG: nucleotidyl transferase AbiEii/AbiGii toxin family protein [Deltaproteobacteria bacterium]|nr:nucleotidyl transferase AbiEii/AbiGii toxin family protein [Deltaproteobacteria bacterium]